MNEKTVVILLSILATGCSPQILKIDHKVNIEKPENRYTNLTKALECSKKKIQSSSDRDFGYMFAVADMVDGTLPNPTHNSPLSDRMSMELSANLHNTTKGYGVILSNFPPMYLPINLNSSGEVNGEQLDGMIMRQVEKVNTIRQGAIDYNRDNNIDEKVSLYAGLKPIVVSGAFTRNDETPMRRKNFGIGLGNSGTDSGDSQYGKTSGYKALSLNVTLSNPEINQITSSKTFTIFNHEADTGFNLNLGVGEGSLNLSNEDILIESKHGAQQTLIDAASIWILDRTYGNVADIRECLK